MAAVTHDEVHRQFDPHFFADYALFSGTLRHYVAKSLEDLLKADPNDVHRRFFIVGLYREEYAAYEDMGAIVAAFVRFRRKELKFPIEGVLRYKPDNVVLEGFFNRYDIKSADDLYVALGVESWIPGDWHATYPSIDCVRVLKRMCRFMFLDCQANQKRYGIDAYNRIKHGLAFVPNGGRYLSGLPNAPAVLVSNPQPKSNPYVLLGLPMDDAKLEERSKLVEFIQSTLRALVSFYLIGCHAEFLRENRKVSPALRLFELPPLLAVRDFMQQLSEKPEPSNPQPQSEDRNRRAPESER
jgi:hypothetical protein